MRFATFNISSGRSPADGRVDPDRFADAIASLDADVLALQEVDRDQRRSGGVDLTAVAAAAMNAPHSIFAPALYGTPGSRWHRAGAEPERGPAYGWALISRAPLRDAEVVRMPAVPVVLPLYVPGVGVVPVREEPRVAVIARIDLGPTRRVTLVATHLAFVPGWKQRQLRRLVNQVSNETGPVVLLGDLNLRADAAARVTGYRSLAGAPTFPSARPRIQLDHILLRGPLSDLGQVTATSAVATVVSDHRALIVEVDVSARVDRQ